MTAAPVTCSATELDIPAILAAVAQYTMVHETGIEFTASETVRLIQSEIPGVMAECGVWRGGAVLAMLLAQQQVFGRVVRPAWLFDSFEGLPKVDSRDGPLAAHWQDGGQPEKFLDNCRASAQQLKDDFARFGFIEGQDYHVVQGWFDQTLPVVLPQLAAAGIALLRADGDWYKSTRIVLDLLEPCVAEGGIVVIDDYYAWDGCARATHDYLSAHDKPYRIKSLPYNFAAYFVKRQARQSFEEF